MSEGIHQVLAGAAPRDAITNHALRAQEVIRSMGFRSEVLVDSSHLSREITDLVRPHGDWEQITEAGDRAILHYSIDSPAFLHVLDRAPHVALHYHNVTPPELLWRDAPHIALACRDGRERLGHFASRARRAAADSHFNAQEMTDLGFRDPTVIGILRPDAQTAARHRHEGPPRLLFIGRGVPNKCQHDLILSLAALRDAGVHAELRLIGSWGSNRAYLHRCLALAAECGVRDQVHVLHSVSDQQLADELATADVFVCLSEHEGYGVPIIEAMAADLPIVAYAAGAIPETLGAAGLLLNEKHPSLVAEAIAAVLDGGLASEMGAARGPQLAQHSDGATADRLRNFVEDFAQC